MNNLFKFVKLYAVVSRNNIDSYYFGSNEDHRVLSPDTMVTLYFPPYDLRRVPHAAENDVLD